MFNNIRMMEYALEVLRAFHHNPGVHMSRGIHDLVLRGGRLEVSQSYLQKILQRMSKLGMLQSSEEGYSLAKPLDEIMVSTLMELNDMPVDDSPLYQICVEIKQTMALSSIDESYDFSKSPNW